MSRQIKNTENTLHQTFKQAGFHQIDDDYSALCQDNYNSSHQAVSDQRVNPQAQRQDNQEHDDKRGRRRLRKKSRNSLNYITEEKYHKADHRRNDLIFRQRRRENSNGNLRASK